MFPFTKCLQYLQIWLSVLLATIEIPAPTASLGEGVKLWVVASLGGKVISLKSHLAMFYHLKHCPHFLLPCKKKKGKHHSPAVLCLVISTQRGTQTCSGLMDPAGTDKRDEDSNTTPWMSWSLKKLLGISLLESLWSPDTLQHPGPHHSNLTSWLPLSIFLLAVSCRALL